MFKKQPTINTKQVLVNNQGVQSDFVSDEEAHKVIGVLALRILEAEMSMEKEKVLISGQEVPSVAPFVVVTLGAQRFETRVVEKVHPVWNQEHNILIHNDTMEKKINIDIMNMSSFTRYQKLGSVSILVSELVRNYDPIDTWIPITTKIKNKLGRKLKVPIARLHLKYTLMPMEEVTSMFWTNMAKQYDFDKNGEIDPFELACMLQGVGSTLDDAEIEDLMRDRGDIRIQQLPEVMKNARKNHLIRITNCPVCQERISTARDSSSTYAGDKELSIVETGRTWEGGACIEDAEVIAHIGPCVNQQVDEDLLNRNFVVDMVGISWWKDGLPEFKNYTQHIRDSGNFVVYDRITKKCVEEKIPVFSKMAMRAVYSVLPRQPEVAKEFLSKMTRIVGNKYNDPKSRRHISEFIRFYEINVDDLADPISSYQNFNEFFRRKMKAHSRPVADVRNQHIAVVPADCRIVGYETVSETSTVWVKGHGFNIASLLNEPDLTRRFVNGSVAICRLGPMDAHRFFFPVGGKVGRTFYMDGEYLIDNPVIIREDVDVYTTNKRTVTVMEDTAFGLVAMVCVGSTMVGSIELTSKQDHMVKKGDEHGYFQFGGSTVILLFEPNTIVFAEDILTNSAIPIETYCRTGSPLGVLRK